MGMAMATVVPTSSGSSSTAGPSLPPAKRRSGDKAEDNIFTAAADGDDDDGDAMPETGLPIFPSAQGIIPGGKIAAGDDKGLFDDLGPTKEELAPGPAMPKDGSATVKLPGSLLGGPAVDDEADDTR